jgi:RNA polymerase sigma-70 factor (ECF subfamily)
MTESNQTNADEERFMISRLAHSGHQREAATASLFRRYAPLFQGYFQRHGLRPAEAEELVQEVFILILRGASGYRSSAAPPSAWLWMIARNALISYQRRKEPVVDNEQAYAAALEQWGDNREPSDEELADCVKRQFAQFAIEHVERAEVLEYIAWHGWKPHDVATLLGRSFGATREYLSQCRKMLRPYLEACRELLEGA